MRVDIVGRKKDADGVVTRELSCGHKQLEGRGGKVAFTAYCRVCAMGKATRNPSVVFGPCTALVFPLKEQRARPCGADSHFKNAAGEPRCARHNRRAVRR